MYRDVAQWTGIRRRILRDGISIRQVGRETGISCMTIGKMLKHPAPEPYGPRERRYPKLGPHIAIVQRLLRENITLPPSARLSVQAIYEHICDKEGFSGSYGSVKDYARPITRDRDCFWEDAIDFLFTLSRADPPVISPERTEQFFRDAARKGHPGHRCAEAGSASRVRLDASRSPKGDRTGAIAARDRQYP
jgi:hypothetical protein